MSTDYEIFLAAESNNVKTLKACLDKGMDPNIRDYDRGATPLHWACNKGHVEAIEMLIDAGADVNAANKRGRTPLHSLAEMKYYKIVLWLIKYCNADPFLQDQRSLTAYDLCQGYMQKEIDECLASIGKEEKVDDKYNGPAATVTPAVSSTAAAAQIAQIQASSSSGSTVTDDSKVLRVHLPNRSYKSVKVGPHDIFEVMAENLCEKLQLPGDSAKYIVIFERIKDRERRVKTTENVFDVVKLWPMIIADGVNQTNKHCYFLAAPLASAPQNIIDALSK